MPFLQKKVYFYITLAVLVTTIFSWFNINSLCIMLLLLCRLIDGRPLPSIKAAFTHKYFLAYFALFLVEALSFFYTHNTGAWGHRMEKNATLVAIPFILCAGPFTDERGYKKFMTAYCALLFAAAFYCLAAAAWHYTQQRDISVFFYHALSHAIQENAIFFSVFVLFGLLFLLSSPIDAPYFSRQTQKNMRRFLVGFFILVIILLASKLLLVILILILAHFYSQRLAIGKNRKGIAIALSLVLLLGVLLVFTKNPIRTRYLDIILGDVSMIDKEHFDPGTYFNGVQLRVLEWRFAREILNENHAWLLGVSAGDSQDLLDKKYLAANMYIGGEPGRPDRGYLGYNFHNQYIENLVHCGLLGLGVLLFLCGQLIALVWRWRTLAAFYTVTILLVLFVTESPLLMQHGLFLSTFFPLLLLYSPRKARETP